MGKREDILDATLDLISEEGLQAASFSKIFKRANVGSGTVYNYFKNKEELVSAIYINVTDHLSVVGLKGYDPAKSVYECFCCLLTNLAVFARDYQKELWFLENYSYSPFIPEKIRNRENRALDECIQIIKRGQEQGILRKSNSVMVMQITTCMLISAVKGALLEKYTLTDEQFKEVLEICWRAIVV